MDENKVTMMLSRYVSEHDGYTEHMVAPAKLNLDRQRQVDYLMAHYPGLQWTRVDGAWYGATVEGYKVCRIQESVTSRYYRQKYGKPQPTYDDLKNWWLDNPDFRWDYQIKVLTAPLRFLNRLLRKS